MATTHATHWVGGEWLDSGTPGTSFNPATGEQIGTYVKATVTEADQAINAAVTAFTAPEWRFDNALRSAVLNSMADRFEAHHDDLVDLLALENGKIKPEAAFEVEMSGPTLRFNAALALTSTGRAGRPAADAVTTVIRQPAGVAGVIAPWNSPVALLLRSLAPALAAGCTAVVSLPASTAQTNALIAKVIAETEGLPAGAVNILIGGREAAGRFVESDEVPVISFTGSTKTGRQILANAAPGLKRVGLELGGKAPMVVFDDADPEIAVDKICSALTVFAGQFCMTGSRLLVQDGIAHQILDAVGKRLDSLKVGPAAESDSQMGPLIDKPNVDRVNGLVEAAISSGANVIVRGGPITDGPLTSGAFYRPTLLEVDDSTLPIVQDEVFGPVLTAQRFSRESDAVALANATPYGLSASVFTKDIDRAWRVSSAIDAGTVWVNDWARLWNQSEEGGFKVSGLGRMRGFAVLDDFVEHKHIAFSPAALS